MTYDPAARERRPTRDEWFLSLLDPVASRGTCPRRQVAAIISDLHGRVLSMGYNGVPTGMIHCTVQPCPGAQDPSGDSRRCRAIHAEINALLQCSSPTTAHTIYVSCYPCLECAKAIANTTIRRVVPASTYPNADGINLLADVGVEIVERYVRSAAAPGEYVPSNAAEKFLDDCLPMCGHTWDQWQKDRLMKKFEKHSGIK